MRRFVAIATACVGAVVLGIGARPVEAADGSLSIAWKWFGADPPAVLQRVLPATLAASEFAGAFQSHRIALHLGAAVLALALGFLTAEGLVRRAIGKRSAWTRLACCAVWWCALDPSIAYFVATRDVLGAKNYLELEDVFRALGIGCFVVAFVAWRVPAAIVGERAIAVDVEGRAIEPREPRHGGRGDPIDIAGRTYRDSQGHRQHNYRTRASLLFAALTAVAVPWILSRAVLDREPLTNDEHAYLFQARVFARGELSYDAHGLIDFFPARQIAQSGERLFSKYPPAHSAMLAIGELVGMPELVPRILAMLTVLLTWDLARRLGAARPTWAAWMFALSPLVLGVESLWLSHSTSIPFAMIVAWSAIVALDSARDGNVGRASSLAALGGAAFSVAFGARPVTALAVALPLVVLLAIERPRGWMRIALAGCLGALPGLALLLWMNHTLTGSSFTFAYEMYAQASSPEDRFGNVTLVAALSNTGFNLSRLSTWFAGWIPGLALPMLACGFEPKLRRRWVLASIPATLVFAYALHPFQGIPWVGPLYVSEGVPELAILGAQGLWIASTWLGRGFTRAAWIATIAASAVLLTNHFAQGRREVESRRDAFRAVNEQGIERGVVFVHYANAAAAKRFPLLPPEPDTELVFARDLGRRNAELLKARGTNDAWLFDPTTGALRRWP